MISIQASINELLKKLKNNHGVVVDGPEKQGNGQQPFAVKLSACYIVCGVVIRNGKILMMREAKKTCYGLWYLPAGKMEPRETIEEAMLREVKEETGLLVEAVSLLCVECPHGAWIRVTFAAKVIGGELKTIDNGDKESLEAAWFPVDSILSNQIKLRSADIKPIIRLGNQWFRMNYGNRQTYLLPKIVDHSYCKLRLLLFKVDHDRLSTFVIRNAEGRLHMPEMQITSSTGLLAASCHALYNKPQWRGRVECHGVVGMEHSGKLFAETDGIRITIAMEISHSDISKETNSQGYEWIDVSESKLKADLFYILHAKLCIPLL